ncbi:hypothetical protein ACIBCN_43700 [Nocardia sp. NPDC051052]|uniref:hypothetical protein n=1 Tax=Nocardia sp. NPDC051052 TaxID=3364322 RepID=UPI0037AC2906
MRSDCQQVPGGFSKKQAEKAETMEAALAARPQQRSARAADGCQVYWPAPYEVCGAIRDKYNELGGPNSFLLFPTSNELSNPDGVGKRSTFQNGPIYWSPDGGAHPVANHFFAAWQRNGWEGGVLGYPTSDEIINPDNVGRRQYFQGGTIYWKLNEAYYIAGAIRDKWGETGWEGGWLGYPTSDETALPDGQGRMNRFERGVVYWHSTTGAQPVTGRILDAWAASGYERGQYRYPVAAQTSPDNGVSVEQRFQGGTITAPGPTTVQLADYLPATPEQVLADARKAIEGLGRSLREAIEQALREASGNSDSRSTPRDEKDAVHLPPARRAGDIFYSDAATGVARVQYEHGHNGIFINTEDTVQALDPDQGVKLVLGNNSKGVYNPIMQEVHTDDAKRAKAAAYARTRVGSGYNSDFAFNRRDWKDGEAGTYNCSQLVWASYMNVSNAGIDLDKDGGWGVWPKDIRDSNWVTRY